MDFFNLGQNLNRLGFDSAVIISGYSQGSYLSAEQLAKKRDLDFLLVLAKKENLIDLMAHKQKELCEIFGVIKAERFFSHLDLDPLYRGYADAVRFSGTNATEQKISIKLITADYLADIFSDLRPGRINVLSKKDKRLYEHKTIDGQRLYFGFVNQKTDTGLAILGDPDLITIRNNYGLGVITDFILSGTILSDGVRIDVNNLKKSLLKKIVFLSDKIFNTVPTEWSGLLIRSERWSKEERNRFNEEVRQVINIDKPNNPKMVSVQNQEYNLSLVSPLAIVSHQPFTLPKKRRQTIAEHRFVVSSGPFSSNSNHGVAIFSDGETSFFKTMLNEFRFRSEIYGGLTASAYFGHLQRPIFTDPNKNTIAYKWNSGDILARERLQKITRESFERLLEIELRKAEDHLNAYILSAIHLKKGEIDNDEIYNSRIHDLYFGRLKGNRLKKFYNDFSVPIADKPVNFFDLVKLPVVINGTKYKPLTVLLDEATNHLNPKRMDNKLKICGLGDTHSGNVMISGNNPDDYIYIDYEFAGFHSPYLDMAKSIYNDSFFAIFYSDILPEQNISVETEIHEGNLVINHKYELDKLSRFLLKTKVEGIILPMRSLLGKKGIDVDSDWDTTLGYALLCCGLLTRNLAAFKRNDFFLNLANAIEATSFLRHYRKLI